MNRRPTHTLATELRDFPEWHRGIRHYAVWTLPVDDQAWQQRLAHLQHRLSPFLHPGYVRQPHITLFAAGLVDNRHFPPDRARQQAHVLRQLELSAIQLRATAVSTFTTAPWLGIQPVDNSLLYIRQALAKVIPEDAPADHYQPHITLGFYQQAYALEVIHTHLAALNHTLPPLPPLSIKRVELCYYATHEMQGRLTVADSVELNTPTRADASPEALDPLEAIKQMRKDQLRVCALKQQAELERLITDAAPTNEDSPTPRS
ncbi:2'-5' RNA ligase family protein [Marinobacterium marinum]|uniref:2'-5' RNA ligase family protein n=1 Tax=Marinobacterium marinum TaxID=2756129 RepID=A0A7W1X0P4_9GAMM|nr:2'-5' RNA ligase family protein [Marinobacterium marinum]MBA4503740.1 2'-5' RNA ligase family protein [Marinobacterium marinum]